MKLATKAKRLRPPIKRHGGGWYKSRHIIPLLPSHRTYLEPYLGGGSVLLGKPKSDREIAGDLDAELMLFWSTLRSDRKALSRAVDAIPYDEASWNKWNAWKPSDDALIERAVAFMVRSRFSRGGLGKTFAWSDRLRGGKPGDVNAWDTIREELPRIAHRIAGVEFVTGSALEMIEGLSRDRDALAYCDPPYHHETRTAKSVYDHEMSSEDHAELLSALNHFSGKVALSGYRCDQYDTALSGWARHDFHLPNNSGQGETKQRRVESLWIKD